jgi:hypothetical protein
MKSPSQNRGTTKRRRLETLALASASDDGVGGVEAKKRAVAKKCGGGLACELKLESTG